MRRLRFRGRRLRPPGARERPSASACSDRRPPLPAKQIQEERSPDDRGHRTDGELLRRAVVLVFGVIQTLIVLRIVLLLLNAREGNDLVHWILNASQVFVAPFIGIFNSDALRAGGSVLDIAAIAALVGWTVLEWIVLWATDLFRREPTVA